MAATSAGASSSPESSRAIRRVAMLFAGGPAPAANAVISTAAASFLRHGIEVIGILHGYAHLVEYRRRPSDEGGARLHRAGSVQAAADAEHARHPDRHLAHQPRQGRVESRPPAATPSGPRSSDRVHRALDSLGVDALVSIGGDDTLKTANKFKRFQEYLPARRPKRIAVVHVPKTIDNDYRGIDFTFGYFTAVEILASEIRNLLADAEAGRMYFLVETMGRSAGWLAYGAAIAGEASLVISVEDLDDDYHDRGDRSPIPRPASDHEPQGHGRREAGRADRPRDAWPREGGQGVRRDRGGRGAGRVPADALPPGRDVRRARAHLAAADQPGQEPGQAGRGRIPAPDRARSGG